MTEEANLIFDPRREQVQDALASAVAGQSEALPEQSIADALMAALILGEVMGVEDEGQYFTMIRAALPNARKAAKALDQ